MPLRNLLSKLTKSLDDFQKVLDHEKENFENRCTSLKEKIAVCEGAIKTYQQKTTGNEEKDIETKNEDLQFELEDVKLKLKKKELKNKELEQDVDELNALLDLYVREAERRDHLEEEWRDKTTKKLRLRINRLEEEMFGKIGEIHNLENTVIELRCELCRKKR
ncbi:hypothetical protein ILUMI_04842 [Ignelater luminosus]|uniref:Uncharacterized protein n=1 Tax=Ignelater luminosus TaxID=2038154 RepID=A0A8K0GJ74_IGNLU|nr:hypothetical protein ILUMI_04842 [Ignelater luminosus]